jgi:predicted DNA-binding transcriptional regulator YafY
MELASRPPFRRLLILDRLVRSGGYPNARTMAAELEVHQRTIHRDLDFLRNSWGAPLEYCPKRHGFFYRDADYAVPLLRLSEGELIALFLAERVMQHYQGTPYEHDLATAFRKLTAHLPEQVTIDLSHLQESFSFRGPISDVGDLRCFTRLARAVREGQQLELVYWTASRNETCCRVVDPYHLTSIAGELYLIAFCHLRESVRMFAPSRIRSARETGEHFERPADFRIENYLDGTFRAIRGEGKVRQIRLRFTAEAARYVREKEWHPTQKLKDKTNGGVEMTLRLSYLDEVKKWVMAYGAECEVLEPTELREMLREELRLTMKMYQ